MPPLCERGKAKMEEIKQVEVLFNSPIESGIRATVILDAAFPSSYDLSTLTLLDHLVVHTSDIDGPESLHPTLPQRSGEILVRRTVIEKGLTLMRRLGLIRAIANNNGITYQATDEAYPFVSLLKNSYSQELKNRALWLAQFVSNYKEEDFRDLLKEKIDRWQVEFQEGSLSNNNIT